MAMPNAKQLTIFSVLVLFLSCQTEARQSKLFFSKYVHLSKDTNYVTIPSTIPNKDLSKSSDVKAPALAPASSTSHISTAPTPLGYEHGNAPAPLENGNAPAPLGNSFAPAPQESENSYYGPYAKGTSTNFPSGETTTNVDDIEEDEEFSNEELSTETPEELNYKESNMYNNAYSNGNNYLSNNNGFWTSNHETYNTDNGYKNEPQGMSDTRLLDNNKYYYNAEHENEDLNGQEFVNENNNLGGYYYGNNKKSKYEFDSMEEYEKQEGYMDVPQDQFIP